MTSQLVDRFLLSTGLVFITVGFVGMIMSWFTTDIGERIQETMRDEGRQTREVIREEGKMTREVLAKAIHEDGELTRNILRDIKGDTEEIKAGIKDIKNDTKEIKHIKDKLDRAPWD